MSVQDWHVPPWTAHDPDPTNHSYHVEDAQADWVAWGIRAESVAHMIAAAPDLLAALKSVARLLPDAFLPGPVPLSITEARAIRAAIEKAEGRAE